MRSLSIRLFFITVTVLQWESTQPSCVSDLNDRRTTFYAVANRNQSGHLTTKFIADSLSAKHSKKLAVDVKSELFCQEQRQGIRIEGVLVAPPSPPEGYNIYPNIGFYKYHEKVSSFDDAKKTCENEGSHLAVPNSVEEGDVLKSLIVKQQSYIGADDRITEGKFMTIFGTPLENFIPFGPNQPDNGGGKEHCVTITEIKKLNDVPCDHKAPFICEFDWIWSD